MFGRVRKSGGGLWSKQELPDPYGRPAGLADRQIAATEARLQIALAETRAIGSLTFNTLGAEVETLNYGEALACGRRAILELTARRVGQQAALDDRTILRWFG